MSIRLLLAAALLIAVNQVSAQAEPSAAVLHLGDGDFLGGALRDCDAPGVVRWQSTIAAAPFDFPVTLLSAIHFPPSENPAAPEGEYGFELSGGDRLFGDLVAISGETITIDSPPLGTLRLARRHVARITRRNAERDWIYLGPNGLAGWKQLEEKSSWREEAGHLIGDVSYAALRLDVELPELATVELEISWKKKPDFVLTFGSNLEEERTAERVAEVRNGRAVQRRVGLDKTRTTGYRFEVWDKSLVVVREGETDADVALISPLELEGRIHLRAYLDQGTGRLSVYSLDGKKLAEIEVPTSDELNGVELTNKRGDVRLEQLAISTWDGRLPMEVALDKPNVQKSDGTVVYGAIHSFDPATKQFVLSGENGQQRIDVADVATALVAPQPDAATGALRAALHDGASITGNLVAVRDGQLQLSRDGIDGTATLPLTAVRSLLGTGRLNLTPPDGVRVGRLETDGVRSHGWLVDGAADGDASCLVWQPRQSSSSSPLAAGFSGRLVYRDPPPPPKPQASRQQVPGRPVPRPGVWGGVLDAFGVRRVELPKQPEIKAAAEALLHLRTGDIIPCQVNGIDQEGVHLASSAVAANFIPHERVQAIELTPSSPPLEIDEKKRARLLTLPRMHRNNPPTHLILAKNGDVLRGRLEEMNLEHLAVELHLEIRDLPREQVAAVIWLHKSDSEGDEEPKPAMPESELLVHALRPDGIRLTFAPSEVRAGALIGNSDILGNCRVDLRTVDVLLLGHAIHDAAQELEYHTWKLTPAPDPRYLQEESAGGAAPPAPASGLVGQPAPDFRLDLLSGKAFNLSEQKGHVVVLDFWASWCGPCMQAMPLVDEVVREFEAQGVKLVAVNMQEDQATIEAALERLQLHPLVALDIDGATAEKYEVTAIPQTVVIDAEGMVAKLFVGGGPQMADQLRATLEELTKQE